MSTNPVPLLAADGVMALTGADYADAVLATIDTSTRRLWCSMFLVNFDPSDDTGGRVREVMHAIVRAHRRHLDVRILLDVFRTQPDRIDVNLAAVAYLTHRGVPVRRPKQSGRAASHSKLVIADDHTVVLGSGNFTPGGFGRNDELGIKVRSVDAARDLAERFARGWAEGIEA